MAGVKGWGRSGGVVAPSTSSEAEATVNGLNEVLAPFLGAQASVLEKAAREQEAQLQRANVLMAEAVEAFGGALQKLDVLARDQYQMAMELHRVLEVSLDGEDGAQSVEIFTTRILGTLDLFVQSMLEIGQSSFQLVEETDGIRTRSTAMVEALGELAEVAMRTQMLALNASIEAAHARQFGAGFSVVAAEVQKLSVRSARISDQISGLVHATEAALERTTGQVEVIASKDLNEIIRSKQLADAMVGAISQSEVNAQALVVRMEAVGREVSSQVARSIQALQFEDMVRQILQAVAVGSARLATFALALRALSEQVAQGREPLEALLIQATLECTEFERDVHDSVQASSMASGDVDLF